MLLPAMTFDQVNCRVDFFFCLSFEDIGEEALRAYLPIIRLYTSGVISVKQYGKTLRIRLVVKDIEACFPLTGMATHTSYEHNVIYKNVRMAESIVDTIYRTILELDHVATTMKGDLSGFKQQRQEPVGGVPAVLPV